MATLLRGTSYVTGAASGIGQCTAYALARHGIKNLALVDRNPMDETVAQLRANFPGVHLKAFQLDITHENDVNQSVRDTAAAFGRLDVAVNNAGVAGAQNPTHEAPLSDWQQVVTTNLTGNWICQRAQIKLMLNQEDLGPRHMRGTIINVSSMLGLRSCTPLFNQSAYVASKHGINGLTKNDATLYGPKGIRINSICPGFVETPMMVSSGGMVGLKSEIDRTPLRRMAKMEEVADGIVFLASPMSSFVQGQSLVVDGGWTS